MYHDVAPWPSLGDARIRWFFVATDDDALLGACRRGDRDAWAELFQRYHRLVRSIAISYGLRDDDVEEVVQIVFTIVVRQLDRFRPDTRLAAWLSSVTRRHVWRVLEQRRREFAVADADPWSSHRDVDEAADRDAERGLVACRIGGVAGGLPASVGGAVPGGRAVVRRRRPRARHADRQHRPDACPMPRTTPQRAGTRLGHLAES